VVELGLFVLLFTALAFGFTQAFIGFLVLAEGHEPLKITNTLDPATPWRPLRSLCRFFNEDATTVSAIPDSIRFVASKEASLRILIFIF